MKVSRWHLVVAAAAAVSSLVLTSCSSGGSSSSSTGSAGSYTLPADAQALLDKAMKPPTWQPPASSPKAAAGKFVVSIPCAEAAVGCSRPGDAFLAAAKALGWRTQLIDPAGDPQKTQAALKQALQLGANGVYMAGGSVEQIGPDLLKQMRQAGVAMMVHGGNNQPLGPDGWSAVMNNDYGQTSPVLAAYVAKDSNGAAQVLMVNDSEFPEVDNGYKVFAQTMQKDCPNCKVAAEINYSIVDLQTTLPTRVKAALQANPQINYVYAPYDFAGTQIATAIQQAGRAGKVKVVGADGNPQNLQAIKDGTQAASYARPWELMGWAVADEMNRVFNGQPTVNDARGFQTEDYPMQLLDSTNLPADITAPWNGGIDYKTDYRKLWAVSPS